MSDGVKQVCVGNVPLGGNAPVSIQSMLNRPCADIEGNVEQALRLQKAGCQIIRTAVLDRDAIRLIDALKSAVDIPVVADIHFDYRLAIEAVNAGADKIRLNPGNIGDESRVREVVSVCKQHGVPIRIGVNSGSVERKFLEKYGGPTAQAMVESAFYHVGLVEKYDWDQIVISVKSSDVRKMIQCYRLIRSQCNYPLHLGVTEAGTQHMGILKSAIGIGSLLCDGIGETIRVSLTADPVEEIIAAQDILKACGLRSDGINIISCPTCGRTKVALIDLANQVEKALGYINKPLTVAVMGCAVNGPGEAREADIGVACGDGCGLIFKNGEIMEKVPEEQIVSTLLSYIEQM